MLVVPALRRSIVAGRVKALRRALLKSNVKSAEKPSSRAWGVLISRVAPASVEASIIASILSAPAKHAESRFIQGSASSGFAPKIAPHNGKGAIRRSTSVSSVARHSSGRRLDLSPIISSIVLSPVEMLILSALHGSGA